MTRRNALVTAAMAILGLATEVPDVAAAPPKVVFTILARTDRPMVGQPGTTISVRDSFNREVARGTTYQNGELVVRVAPGNYTVYAQKGRLSGMVRTNVHNQPADRVTVILR